MTGTLTVREPSPPAERPPGARGVAAALRQRPGVAVAIVTVVGMAISWRLRLVGLDDPYISFRYAENAVRGHGLTFNPGERVEGYTNFLWTMLIVPAIAMRIDPLVWSQILGVGTVAASIVLVYRAAGRWIGPGWVAVGAAALFGSNVTALVMATSGMETGLVVMFAAWLLVLAAPGRDLERPASLLGTGVVVSLMILTRMDSVFYVAPLLSMVAIARIKGRDRLVRSAAWIAAPVVAIVGPWLLWKEATYGSILPNTAAAKAGADRLKMTEYAVLFSAGFLLSYGAVLLAPAAWRNRRSLIAPARFGALTVTVAVWFAYVVWVGGDWMEFRMFTPIVPAGAILGAHLVHGLAPRRRAIVAGLLGVLALAHALPPQIGPSLLLGLDDGGPPAFEIGETLQAAFPGEIGDTRRPTIAMVGVGIVPYVSKLRTVDVIGLTDPEIAANGDRPRLYVPGHARHATIDQLVDRGVDMIVLQSDYKPLRRTSLRLSQLAAMHPVVDLGRLPTRAYVADIPMSAGRVIHAIVLSRHPMIESKVSSGSWARIEIERRCDRRDITDGMRVLGSRTCDLVR